MMSGYTTTTDPGRGRTAKRKGGSGAKRRAFGKRCKVVGGWGVENEDGILEGEKIGEQETLGS